jgi:hypothetical protein
MDELLQNDPLNINGIDYQMPDNKEVHAWPAIDAPIDSGMMP